MRLKFPLAVDKTDRQTDRHIHRNKERQRHTEKQIIFYMKQLSFPHVERERERERDRQRQADGQTEGQKDTKRDRETFSTCNSSVFLVSVKL